MNFQTPPVLSLKITPQNEIILLLSLKNPVFFKENLSLKTFDAAPRFRLHPSRTQGFLKELFL